MVGDPMSWETVTDPKPGDSALHRSNQLDARTVTRVEGEFIWIDILGHEDGPLPAANYWFSRDLTACYYCGPTDRELRRYGPGGSSICYPCATATPERDAASGAAFTTLLDAAAAISTTGIVAIGEETGPRPFDPGEVTQ